MAGSLLSKSLSTAYEAAYSLKSSAGTFAVIHKSRMMTKGDRDFGVRKPQNLNDLLEEARLAGLANSLKCFLKVHFYRKTLFSTLLKNVTLSLVMHYSSILNSFKKNAENKVSFHNNL